jgi:hypothetical protein
LFFSPPLTFEKPILPLQLRLEAFSPLAMLNKHRNADHRQAKPIRESTTRITSHHAPNLVVVHQFTKKARARQACKRTQVHSGFRVSAAREDAAWSRP